MLVNCEARACTLRNHTTGESVGSHGELTHHQVRTSYKLLQYTVPQLARSVLLWVSMAKKYKRSKLSEHTEQKEEHAARMVRDIAGQRDRKHHASLKVKADGRSLLIALGPARHISLYMTKIKIKLSYKLQYFFFQ